MITNVLYSDDLIYHVTIYPLGVIDAVAGFGTSAVATGHTGTSRNMFSIRVRRDCGSVRVVCRTFSKTK